MTSSHNFSYITIKIQPQVEALSCPNLHEFFSQLGECPGECIVLTNPDFYTLKKFFEPNFKYSKYQPIGSSLC